MDTERRALWEHVPTRWAVRLRWAQGIAVVATILSLVLGWEKQEPRAVERPAPLASNQLQIEPSGALEDWLDVMIRKATRPGVILERNAPTPHHRVLQGRAQDLGTLADFLEALPQPYGEPSVRRIWRDGSAFAFSVVLPTAPPAPRRPQGSFHQSNVVSETLRTLFWSWLLPRGGEPPSLQSRRPAEAPASRGGGASGAPERQAPNGFKLDEIELEGAHLLETFWTSAGAVARLRVRDQEILVRGENYRRLIESLEDGLGWPVRGPGAPQPTTPTLATPKTATPQTVSLAGTRRGRDPFVPLDGTVPAARKPSALVELSCKQIAIQRVDRLEAALGRARQRVVLYHWDLEQLETHTSEAAASGVEVVGEDGLRRALARALADDLAQTLGNTLRGLEPIHAVPEPSPAEMLGLLGDFELIADRPAAAAEAYRSAGELAPGYAPLCGRLHGEHLVGIDRFVGPRSNGSSRWIRPVPAVLVWNREATLVLERHPIPAWPEAFEAVSESLRISLDDGTTLDLDGSPQPAPPWPPRDAWDRPLALWGGSALAMNFVGFDLWTLDYGGPFLVEENLDDQLPVTLGELEVASRKAMARDPTQAWHRFWLGQALWFQGRRTEAADLWESVWEGEAGPLGPDERLWMAAFHETYGQQSWSDRAYASALAASQTLGKPSLEAGPSIDRRALTAVDWLDEALKTDPDRRALWWSRVRELSGPAWSDAFRSALWVADLQRRGRVDAARREQAALDKARKGVWDTTRHLAWLDYAFYGLVAMVAVVWARWVIVLARCLGAGPVDAAMWRRACVEIALASTLALALLPGIFLAASSFAVVLDQQWTATASHAVLDPSWLSAAELWRAWFRGGVMEMPGGEPPRWVDSLEAFPGGLVGFWGAGFLGIVVGTGLLALPVAWCLRRPGLRRWGARWIPGASAAHEGRDLEAALRFGVFVLAVVPLVWLGYGRVRGDLPVPGVASAHMFLESSLQGSMLPMPEAPSKNTAADLEDWEALCRRDFVPLLRAFPGADGFYAVVLMACWITGQGLVRARRVEV